MKRIKKRLKQFGASFLAVLTIFLSVFGSLNIQANADDEVINVNGDFPVVKGKNIPYNSFMDGGSWSTHMYTYNGRYIYCIESNKSAPPDGTTSYTHMYMGDKKMKDPRSYKDLGLLACAVAHGPGGELEYAGRLWWIEHGHPEVADNVEARYVITHIAANYAYAGISDNDPNTIYKGVPASWISVFDEYMAFLGRVLDEQATYRDPSHDGPEYAGQATTWTNFYVYVLETPAGGGDYQKMAFAGGQVWKGLKVGFRIKIDINKTTAGSIDYGRSLDGAEFALFTEEGKQVGDKIVLHRVEGKNENIFVSGEFYDVVDLGGTSWDGDNPYQDNKKFYVQEIKAPDGFQIDPQKHWLTFKRNVPNGVMHFVTDDPIFDKTDYDYNNQVTPIYMNVFEPPAEFSITVQKNGNPKFPVTGTTYGIYDNNTNALIDTININQQVNGNYVMKGTVTRAFTEAEINKWYYVLEKDVPTGYLPDTTKYYFFIYKDTTTGALLIRGNNGQSFENGSSMSFTPTGVAIQSYEPAVQDEIMLSVEKEGVTGFSVAGAKYGVYKNVANEQVGTITIDTKVGDTSRMKGILRKSFTSEDTGWYYIKEISAPANYKLDQSTYYFQVYLDGKHIKIKGNDAQVDANGKMIANPYLIYNGSKLEVIANSLTVKVTSKEPGPAKVTICTQKNGTEGMSVAGAVYDIKNYVTGEVIDSITIGTEVDGTTKMSGTKVVYFTHNDVGVYEIRENQDHVPPGYAWDRSHFLFQVYLDNNQVKIKALNNYKNYIINNGALNVNGLDIEHMRIDAVSNEPPASLTATIQKNGVPDLPVEGAVYNVIRESDGAIFGTISPSTPVGDTNSAVSGTAVLNFQLEDVGTYYIQEDPDHVPEGYLPDTSKYYFNVSLKSGVLVLEGIDDKASEITSGNILLVRNSRIDIQSFEPIPATLKLQVEKYGTDTGVTKPSVKGAVYNIYKRGKGVGQDTLFDSIKITNALDQDELKAYGILEKVFTLNDIGNYYIMEDPKHVPDGYSLDDSVFSFSVVMDDNKVKFEANNDTTESIFNGGSIQIRPDAIAVRSIEPTSENLDIMIEKEGNPNFPVEGAVYTVYKKSTDGEDTIFDTIEISSQGTGTLGNAFSSSDVGEYYIKETVIPTGYEADESIYRFRVAYDETSNKLYIEPNFKSLSQLAEGCNILVSRTGGLLVLSQEPSTVQPVTLTFNVQKNGETGISVENAVYFLYKYIPNTNQSLEIGNIVIDTEINGKSKMSGTFSKEFTKNDVGIYYIKEISAPEGYLLDNSSYYFEVKVDENNILKIVENSDYESILENGSTIALNADEVNIVSNETPNTVSVKLIVQKNGDESFSVEGAVYDVVRKSDDQTIGTMTIDTPVNDTTKMSGTFEKVFTKDEVGEYYIKEEIVPIGYGGDPSKYAFKIIEKDGKVQLEADSASSNIIGGGEIIQRNATTIFVQSNEPLLTAPFTITVKKKGVTGFPVIGAKYNIYKAVLDGDVLFDTIEIKNATDGSSQASGKISKDFTASDIGRYYIMEDVNSVPFGYLSDNSKFYFDVMQEGNELKFKPIEDQADYIENGSTEIVRDADVEVVSQETPLEAELKITVQKNGKDGYPVENAVYNVVKENGDIFDTITINTEVDGTTKMSGSHTKTFTLNDLGTYYIEEKTAPAGYLKDTSKFYFKVIRDNNTIKFVEYDNQDGIVNGGSITVVDKTVTAISIEETPKANITLKVQKNGTNTYSVKDAVYTVYKKETTGATIFDIITIDTPVNNTAVMSGTLTKEFTVDDIGDYYIEETNVPDGYKRDTSNYEFSVVLDGTTLKCVTKDGTNQNILNGCSIVVTDAEASIVSEETPIEATFTLKVQKEGVPDRSVAGAKYTVYKRSTGAVFATIDIKTKVTGSYVMSGSVSKKFTLNDIGEYYFKETTAPDGYILDPTEYSFKVINNNSELELVRSDMEGGTVTIAQKAASIVSVEDEKKYPFKLTLTKNGDSADTVATVDGAEYSLYSCESELTAETTKKLINTITLHVSGTDKTTATGNTSAELPAGSYFVQETKAPVGYKLDEELHFFTINTDGTVSTIDPMYNDIIVEQGEISIESRVSDQADYVPFMPSITVQKDGECNVPDDGSDIRNTKFGLYDNNDNLLQEIKLEGTSANKASGQFSYMIKEPGRYYIKETDAAANFIIDNTKHWFTVSLIEHSIVPDDGQPEFVVDNQHTNAATLSVENVSNKFEWGIVINKTGKSTGDYTSLEGTVYGLYNEAGTLINQTTLVKENNKIVGHFDNIIETAATEAELQSKKYYVQEVAPTTGFRLNDEKYEFEVKIQDQKLVLISNNVAINDNIITIDAENVPEEAKFNFIKKGEDDYIVSGAVFEVYLKSKLQTNTDGTYKFGSATPLQTLTSDANGLVQSDILNLGTYVIRETEVSDEYQLIEPFEIVLDTDNQNLNVNEVYGDIVDKNVPIYIRATKKDTGSGKIVLKPGTTYQIKNNDNELVKDLDGNTEFVCDESGIVFINAPLSPDTYTITEVLPPNAYLPDSQPVVVTVDSKLDYVIENGLHIHDVDFSNTEKLGKITITKSGETLTSFENGKFNWTETPLPDAVFEVRAAENVYSSDNQGTLILAKDALAGTITTGTNGTATISNLHTGKYYLVETLAPAGYVLEQTKIDVEVKDDTTAAVVTKSATKFDERKNISLVLHKEDEETSKPLANAEFKLYAAEDIKNFAGEVIVTNGTEIVTAVSGTDGNIDFSDVDLPFAKFIVKETKAPTGYVLNSTEFAFDLVNPDNNEKTVSYTGNFTNKPVKGKITITKSGKTLTGYEDGKFVWEETPLPGAIFEVRANEDIYSPDSTDTLLYAKNKVAGTITTGANGSTTIENLPLGKYYLVEVKAPAGYLLDQSKIEAELKYADSSVSVVTESTTKFDEKQDVVLNLHKIDDVTKESLSGAEFELYAAEDIKNFAGKVVVENGTKLASAISDKDGNIDFGLDLPFSKYTVKEIKAPVGYALSEAEFTFEVKADASVPEVIYEKEIANTPVTGEVTFIKTGETLVDFDKTTGKFTYEKASLKGAEFDLYFDKETTPLMHLTTDEKGTAKATNLKLGKYRLVETKAPYGMTLLSKPYEFEVKYQDQNTPIVLSTESILDNRQKVELSIAKKNTSGEKLSGGTFELYAEEDIKNYKDEIIVKKDELITKTSAKDGVIDFGLDLPHGKYYVKETAAPSGYQKTDKIFSLDGTYKSQDIELLKVECLIENTKTPPTPPETPPPASENNPPTPPHVQTGDTNNALPFAVLGSVLGLFMIMAVIKIKKKED